MRLSERIEIRLHEKHRALLQRAAEARGWRTSFFIREAALEAARKVLTQDEPVDDSTEPVGS